MIDLSAWPALVLTAGLATRLRPLSDLRAKAALPVAGEPLVGRILRSLHAAGIRRVVLNLHHRPETVTRLVGDGEEWGLEVRYSWEVPLLGSAGGPKRAVPLLDAERFLIINGDTLTDCDLRALAGQHLETGAQVTLAVIEKDVDRIVIVDGHTVRGFTSRAEHARQVALDVSRGIPATTAMHFIGVQAVNAAVFDDVPDNQPYETMNKLYPALIARHSGSVQGHRSRGEFLDVGTAADYLETVRIISAREQRPWDRGADCVVHPTARIERSILWDRVTVGAGATLVDCVVGDGVDLPAGAHYERRVLVATENGLTARPL